MGKSETVRDKRNLLGLETEIRESWREERDGFGGGRDKNPGLNDYISISITSQEITDVALEQVAWPAYKEGG